jgi:maltooligosyltrehalose trehalohydrolase
LVSPAAYRAASALLLLAPYTPLIFMGQEWAASSPFLYFTDHNADLGRKVTAGRRREFRHFAAFRDPAVRKKIPSPQAEETFHKSKLNWSEPEVTEKRGNLDLYGTCIRLRRTIPCLQDRSRNNWRVVRVNETIAIVYGLKTNDRCIVVADLTGAGIAIGKVKAKLGIEREMETLFSSNDERYCTGRDETGKQPETILLQVA